MNTPPDADTPPAAIIEHVASMNDALLDPAWFRVENGARLAVREHKDSAYRLRKFKSWLDERSKTWLNTPLSEYRDHLLSNGKDDGTGYAPGTVSGHLSTIRNRIAELNTAELRQTLYDRVPAGTPPADAKAFVDETLERLRLNTDARHSKVQISTVQDKVDSDHVRLTAAQCNELVNLPDVSTLIGMRDAALLALMLATGIREAEAAALMVDDLRQTVDGKLVLRVTNGKGRKQRVIPYGKNKSVLRSVDTWLARAGITSGKVFRGFYKPRKDAQGNEHYESIRSSLSVRGVQKIIAGYRVTGDDGKPVQVRPHDLRRSYARRQYDMGKRTEQIQQNLGHASAQTTLGYIGDLDMSARESEQMFTLNYLSELDKFDLA